MSNTTEKNVTVLLELAAAGVTTVLPSGVFGTARFKST